MSPEVLDRPLDMRFYEAVFVIYFCITNYPKIQWFKYSPSLSVGQELGSSLAEWLWLGTEVIYSYNHEKAFLRDLGIHFQADSHGCLQEISVFFLAIGWRAELLSGDPVP